MLKASFRQAGIKYNVAKWKCGLAGGHFFRFIDLPDGTKGSITAPDCSRGGIESVNISFTYPKSEPPAVTTRKSLRLRALKR